MTDPVDPATGRRPRGGRPAKLTPELTASIAQVVSAGNYLKTAAQFHGVGQSTLLGWMARGRAASAQVDLHAADPPDATFCPACGAAVPWYPPGAARPMEEEPYAGCPHCGAAAEPTAPWRLPATEELYLTFLEAVTQAETVAEVAAVTHWRRAFPTDWRAARDYLSRKRPEQWAAKTTVAISTDEADARIQAATLQALTDLGVDTDGLELRGTAEPGEPPEEPFDPLDGLDF